MAVSPWSCGGKTRDEVRRAFCNGKQTRMTRTFIILQVSLTVLPTYLGSSAEFTRGVLCSMVIVGVSGGITGVSRRYLVVVDGSETATKNWGKQTRMTPNVEIITVRGSDKTMIGYQNIRSIRNYSE